MYMLKEDLMLILYRINENMLQDYSYFIARYFHRFSYGDANISFAVLFTQNKDDCVASRYSFIPFSQ